MRLIPALLLTLAASLAACSSTGDSNTASASDVGKTYNQLVMERGQPTKAYDLVGDTRLIQYTNQSTLTDSNGKSKVVSCTARFWLMNEKVKQVTYDGDDSVCESARRNSRRY
jgi:hypothetical protein